MPAPIVAADSITRVGPEAAGAVVVNASHGGVYAAYLAAKLHAAAAIFNDAGVGRDRAGIGGLDYLQEFGIAAATVGHNTARIGDGADMVASGVITHANAPAISLGVSPGQSCRDGGHVLLLHGPMCRDGQRPVGSAVDLERRRQPAAREPVALPGPELRHRPAGHLPLPELIA